jgi:hypothetical protein
MALPFKMIGTASIIGKSDPAEMFPEKLGGVGGSRWGWVQPYAVQDSPAGGLPYPTD